MNSSPIKNCAVCVGDKKECASCACVPSVEKKTPKKTVKVVLRALSSIGSKTVRLVSAMLGKGPAKGKRLPKDRSCDIIMRPECETMADISSTGHCVSESSACTGTMATATVAYKPKETCIVPEKVLAAPKKPQRRQMRPEILAATQTSIIDKRELPSLVHRHQEVPHAPADQSVVEQTSNDNLVDAPSKAATVDAEPVPQAAKTTSNVTPCRSASSSGSDSGPAGKRPRDLEAALQLQLAKLTEEHILTSVGLGEDRPMLSLSEWDELQQSANESCAGYKAALRQLNASLKPVWAKLERDNGKS